MNVRRFSPARIINIILLTLLGAVMLYPFWYVICYALSDYEALLKVDFLIWPQAFTLKNVQFILSTSDFLHIYQNTLVVVVVGIPF